MLQVSVRPTWCRWIDLKITAFSSGKIHIIYSKTPQQWQWSSILFDSFIIRLLRCHAVVILLVPMAALKKLGMPWYAGDQLRFLFRFWVHLFNTTQPYSATAREIYTDKIKLRFPRWWTWTAQSLVNECPSRYGCSRAWPHTNRRCRPSKCKSTPLVATELRLSI